MRPESLLFKESIRSDLHNNIEHTLINASSSLQNGDAVRKLPFTFWKGTRTSVAEWRLLRRRQKSADRSSFLHKVPFASVGVRTRPSRKVQKVVLSVLRSVAVIAAPVCRLARVRARRTSKFPDLPVPPATRTSARGTRPHLH